MPYVPLSEVIATAQSTMSNITTQDKMIFLQWIGLLCMPELGISEDDVKVVSLFPNNYTVEKPDDIRAIIDVNLFDCNGCQIPHIYRTGAKRIYRDDRFPRGAIVDDPNNTILPRLVPVDISDDNFQFWLGTNGDHVKTIVLRYYTFPVDDAGLPLIRQEETLAIIYFLHFIWAVKQNDNQSEIAAKELRWKIQADRVRAAKKMTSVNADKMKYISKSVWNRLIPNFNYSNF